MSERIIKSSISVFEAMNGVRNKSLAHDNPNLVDPDEARYIFDSVTATPGIKVFSAASYFGGDAADFQSGCENVAAEWLAR